MKKPILFLYFLIGVILLLEFSTAAFGAIPAEERAALIALYNNTNGNNWADKTGWKTSPLDTDGFAMPGTEGNWKGVSVSGDHVIALDLRQNRLTGIIPTEIGNLSNLDALLLGNDSGNQTNRNQLCGNIPSQLGNLTRLENLHLSGNHLSGAIPPELGTPRYLQYIEISDNQLSGAIPSQLGNLTFLRQLDLSNNQLTGTIPSQFGNFDEMYYLYLNNNQLTGAIPSQLGNLTYLRSLKLHNNRLSGTIPTQLGNLYNLQILELHVNQLSGSIPSQLGNLSQLETLFLSDNQLSGSIPYQLGNLNKLNDLYLNKNQLSGSIPSQLGNLSDLLYLYLSDNQLSGSIPYQLGNLSKLLYLSLHDNQLSGTIPSQLGNLSSLNHLSLRDNQLTGSIPSQLGNLIHLDYFAVRNNQLSGSIPTELGNLVNLTYLRLSNNRLSGVIPSSLLNLKKVTNLDIGYNCLSTTDSQLRAWLSSLESDWEANQNQCAGEKPTIGLNRSQLNFGAVVSGSIPDAQSILISNTGSGALNWTASSTASFLCVTPASGTGNSAISISVNTTGLSAGNYSGAILIIDSNATNSPQIITVSLHLYEQGKTSGPFGELSTPLNGSTLSNSIPVTGWVLDDIGVSNVKIYNGDTYIGDAVFMEGARPDVETAFPTYPNNYKAGWGYMLLTFFLPNGGNGTYTLTAKATDMEGNEVIVGSKTITIDNAHTTKPFGAIDTPIQGGTASGKEFVNFGWVLTPQPNVIPPDGSTIDVVIDGVVKGHPEYGNFRSDIVDLFSGFANTNGAGGYFYFDTTPLTNGYHTISWNVTDSAGNSDGIGSRYFSVMNVEASMESLKASPMNSEPLEALSVGDGDVESIEMNELGRVEIRLSDEGTSSMTHFQGYMMVGDQFRALPVGSTLDREKGIFYWQPGPGFVGEYRFVFIGKRDKGECLKKSFFIHIRPDYSNK
ncbi:MAG: BACON domain-containing protein [Candidatus Omnitrophota bacterium]